MLPTVSLSKSDWSLHRKGPIDQARHNERVKEAIKDSLGDIVSQESIITSDGKKIVKIPIRSLELPRFRFDRGRKKHAGQGQGGPKVGDVIVRAARDKGEIKPGDDTPIDVWLTTADGKPATVIAVRLWIGTEDAKGSIKAKADVEDPNQPSHWHTYGEAPEPIPLEAKLWVEIEPTSGSKLVCSFDLKV